MELDGRVAVVTGAGRGIGRAIAESLARCGARVVAGDVDATALDNLASALTAAGRQVVVRVGDIAQRANADGLVDAAVQNFGAIDILVNNAGINRDAMLHKMTDEQWQRVIDVDLTAAFYTTRCAGRYMRERKYGRIVNISSASWLGSLGQANYAAAKAGIVGLTLTAARELARYGVTANAICPGFIDTDMTRAVPPAVWEGVVDRIPAGHAGDPTDVANVVCFLSSEATGYVTGQIINVNGGLVW